MTTAVHTRPPSPEWLAPPLPWDIERDEVSPPTGPAPLTSSEGRRAWVAAVAAVVVVSLLAYASFAALGSRHGQRPTIGAISSSNPAATPFAPVTPGPSTPAPGLPPAPSATPAQGSAVATKVDPGVVDINTVVAGGEGAGTGMVVTADGEVLTNNHVVNGAISITVTLVSSGRTFPATVLGTDKTHDIALLKLRGAAGLATIPLGDSSTVTVGQPVVAIGNARGAGGAPEVSTGAVEALNQTMTASDTDGSNPETLQNLIEISAPLQPGDSGGPLATTSGQVIGMNSAAAGSRRFRLDTSIGFAIPINQAMAVVHQIERGEASMSVRIGVPGFLGIGLARSGSATVTSVQPGSPASRLGLAAGAVITTFDGHTVASADDLSTLIHAHKPGESVTVRWTDSAGASHSGTVALVAGPPD